MDIVKIRNNINNHFKGKKEEYKRSKEKHHNDIWNVYYQDRRWKNLRDYYYSLYPCCEVCEKEGIVIPTDNIHHLRRFAAGLTEEAKYNLLLNPDNLISVCSYHHKIFHKLMRERNVDEISINEVIAYDKENNNT